MGTAERRNEIMKILCRRRHENIQTLAEEFAVSMRTIQRDIEVLSLTYPIYTKAGRYGGGVFVMDGYYLGRMYMKDEELGVLKKLSYMIKEKDILTGEEKRILNNIIAVYSKPAV